MAEKFIKKPVVIEAMPFDGSWESAKPILDWIVDNKALDLSGPTWFDRADGELRIHTLEGTLTASAGDWIIRGIKGEFYPCKPDIFKETYEPAFTDAQDACVAIAAPALPEAYHIVFDGFPSPNGPRFIELEDQNGHSLGIGAWRKREDGHAELVLLSAPAPTTTVKVTGSSPPIFHQRQENDMNFGQAIEALKAGRKVARAGWNGKGMFLIYVPGTPNITPRDGTPYASAVSGPFDINPHIDMKTATGQMQPGWLASQTDMLADDWEIVA